MAALGAAKERPTFNDVRQVLHRRSARKAPPSKEAMWTVARDVLSELQKLGFATVGTLPRKRSEVERLSETPCELTEEGRLFVRLILESQGRAFDRLLIIWLNEHPYFRNFTSRLLDGPLYVPDITTLKQVGVPAASASLADRVIGSCLGRLDTVGFSQQKKETFESAVRSRVAHVERHSTLGELDAKRWIDLIEDYVVIPAFLAAENLPFDAVTFQQLIRVSQEFLSASWTSSHPDFEGRLIFATCHFEPPLQAQQRVERVIHHGKTYTSASFASAIQDAYKRLAGNQGGYVDAYSLRALVCMGLQIQPIVFAHSFEELIRSGSSSGMTVFTELPFAPPPWGEQYVEVGTRRVGLIKIIEPAEAKNGT